MASVVIAAFTNHQDRINPRIWQMCFLSASPITHSFSILIRREIKERFDTYTNQIITTEHLRHYQCSDKVTYRTLPNRSEFIRFKFYSKIKHITWKERKNTLNSENADDNVFTYFSKDDEMNIITLFNVHFVCI